jgi:hypothetical protein
MANDEQSAENGRNQYGKSIRGGHSGQAIDEKVNPKPNVTPSGQQQNPKQDNEKRK